MKAQRYSEEMYCAELIWWDISLGLGTPPKKVTYVNERSATTHVVDKANDIRSEFLVCLLCNSWNAFGGGTAGTECGGAELRMAIMDKRFEIRIKDIIAI